jgi:hypothetical protein
MNRGDLAPLHSSGPARRKIVGPPFAVILSTDGLQPYSWVATIDVALHAAALDWSADSKDGKPHQFWVSGVMP